MRARAETIRLGSRDWLVRPLTLAQVQAIEPLLFVSPDRALGSVATGVAILRVALARDHAEAAASLDDIEAGAPDVAAATACVLRLGGFLPTVESPVGEALAGALQALA